MCGVPFSRGNGTFVRSAMKMLSDYSQNTLRMLSDGNSTLKVAVRGAGLKLQCSWGGAGPRRGAAEGRPPNGVPPGQPHRREL